MYARRFEIEGLKKDAQAVFEQLRGQTGGELCRQSSPLDLDNDRMVVTIQLGYEATELQLRQALGARGETVELIPMV